MKILGIHDGHNASAALIENGKIIFAIQEERLNRIKNYEGFPFLAVEETLRRCKLEHKDIDIVAMSSKYVSLTTREESLEYFKNSSSMTSRIKQLLKKTPVKRIHRGLRKEGRLRTLEKAGFNKGKAVFVEHHISHASASYWGSPFREEKVLVITCDGVGDDLCATANIAHEDGRIDRIASIREEDSLGLLYAMVTFALGMVPNEHEYKIMGMAPYAPVEGIKKSYERFKQTFEFNGDGGLTWRRRSGIPHMFNSYDYVRKLMEHHRFDWTCGGIQKLTEDMLTTWVRNAIRKTGVRKVVLSGGVFMNVKANKAIMGLPELETLFVFPSCGDETNAIGAAWHLYAELKKEKGERVDIPPLEHFYLGGEFSEDEVDEATRKYHFTKKVNIRKYNDIEKVVAELIAKGEVVARFKGRMEFGARALGNRSILANPSEWKVIKIINDMIKNRDFWMPFAPSMLSDRSHEYIVNPKEIKAPYMILTFDTKEEKASKLIAAIHPYDLTCRPQEVYKDWNESYYKLISYYSCLTGEAAILNTSFNLHGYPIVYTPEDALEVFNRSELKYLALENLLLTKE